MTVEAAERSAGWVASAEAEEALVVEAVARVELEEAVTEMAP